jgi:hypothetical protein
MQQFDPLANLVRNLFAQWHAPMIQVNRPGKNALAQVAHHGAADLLNDLLRRPFKKALFFQNQQDVVDLGQILQEFFSMIIHNVVLAILSSLPFLVHPVDAIVG